MNGQAAQQIDGVLGGADRWRLGVRQTEIELGDQAASPAQHQMGAGLLTLHSDDDLLEQGAQQLLAVPVRGGRGGPDPSQIAA